jgi:ATP-binding cassette subfamily B protein
MTTTDETHIDDAHHYRQRGIWSLAWEISQERKREFWLGYAMFILFFAAPAAVGWFVGQAFDALTDNDTSRLYWMAGFMWLAEVFRLAVLQVGAVAFTKSWTLMSSLMQGNMLAAQVASGGPEAGQPVGSAGAAVTHFRDDPHDVAIFVDSWLDVSGAVVYTTIALSIMATIDLPATLVVLVPMVAVALVTMVLDTRIKQYRRADRQATAEVTGLLGDILSAATTVKVNNATASSLDRLKELVDERRRTAVRDRLLNEGLYEVSNGTADIGLALVLMVGAGAIVAGSFTPGELVLFAAYLVWLGFLPRMIGRTIARHKQAMVAFDGMRRLVAGHSAARVAHQRHLPVGLDRPTAARIDAERIPLQELTVESLTARYPTVADDDGRGDGDGDGDTAGVVTAGPGGSYGIRNVSFRLARGSITVVTGPVGAGKSTLLRAILGLAWQAEVTGVVRWNGQVIEDRAAFLVPPQAAFLSQVPQLLSDSVADNIRLGGTAQDDDVARALRLAAVETDIADMPDRAQTMIGPRGLRLSGGQRQRVAAARALVQNPELLVMDDLSSALDVETEIELWSNLAAAGVTVLAVSHRKVALERADQVLTLDRGRLL